MKKSRKLIFWTVLLCSLFSIAIYILFRILNDPTRLTPLENEWLNSNLNKVLNVSVVNDSNIFGSKGVGIFYDFVSDFTSEHNLKVNSITYKTNETTSGISFGISNVLRANEINFYQDHYVLVSKKKELVLDVKNIKEKKIGILSSNVSYVQELMDVSPTLITYNTKEELIKALDEGVEIQSIIVPRMEYIDVILAKDYRINYHFSSIARYYNMTLDMDGNPHFSNVLKKYFQRWKQQDFKNSYYKQEFQAFIQNLNITQAEVDRLQSVTYNYGFINNHPYEILTGGDFGGIVASYLNEFSEFSKIDFNFKRYSNYKKLVTDINNKKVDLYFEYQNFTSEGNDLPTNLLLSYDILLPVENSLVVSSFKSLKEETIYVEDNTLLFSRLKAISGLNIETYEGEKGLKNVIKKKGILIMDHERSQYYQKNILKNYTNRYTGNLEAIYNFRSTSNDVFQKLFVRYLNYLDENYMSNVGSYNYVLTVKNGTILGKIAQYSISIIIITLILIYIIYRSSKHIHLINKLKKEEKLKYIDQLTSLKNRNYLNENISIWNKNTIYPQTIIVMDLDRLHDINDTVGYEEGDKQIKAAANILIKTQLDNTDIMRTDGNEYMIYLIGYQQKQVTNYIFKLNREFKNLPYDFGASIGYSMIENDMKSVEDAINEAIEEVKKQKGIKKEEQEK